MTQNHIRNVAHGVALGGTVSFLAWASQWIVNQSGLLFFAVLAAQELRIPIGQGFIDGFFVVFLLGLVGVAALKWIPQWGRHL